MCFDLSGSEMMQWSISIGSFCQDGVVPEIPKGPGTQPALEKLWKLLKDYTKFLFLRIDRILVTKPDHPDLPIIDRILVIILESGKKCDKKWGSYTV